MKEYSDKILGEVFKRVGGLEGVSAVGTDDIGVKAGHFDDYLLVTYIGQLLEMGEAEISIIPKRMEYFFKLLHLEELK